MLKDSIGEITAIKNGKVDLDSELPITVTPFAHQIVGYNIGMSTTSSALLMEILYSPLSPPASKAMFILCIDI